MYVPVACREHTDNIDLQAMLLMSESRWANLAIEDNVDILEAVATACDQLGTQEGTWTAISARAQVSIISSDPDWLGRVTTGDPEADAIALRDLFVRHAHRGYAIATKLTPEGEVIGHQLELVSDIAASGHQGVYESVQIETEMITRYDASRENLGAITRSDTISHKTSGIPLVDCLWLHIPATPEALEHYEVLRAQWNTFVGGHVGHYVLPDGDDVVSLMSMSSSAPFSGSVKRGSIARNDRGNRIRGDVTIDLCVRVVRLARPLPKSIGHYGVENVSYELVIMDDLVPYEYDDRADDKIVLDPAHHTIIDTVMNTRHLETLHDAVTGKSQGAFILCSGAPGIGKTLTAEITAESFQRPLLRVKASDLGTASASIEKALDTLLKLGTRIDAVVLLDECDVYFRDRGNSLEQGAVVSEFLRVLEYHPGIIIATTNRPDDIDDAILRRATAILHYRQPGIEALARVWKIQAQLKDLPMGSGLVDRLAHDFPHSSPSDIKHVVTSAKRILSLDSSRNMGYDLMVEAAAWRGQEPREGETHAA